MRDIVETNRGPEDPQDVAPDLLEVDRKETLKPDPDGSQRHWALGSVSQCPMHALFGDALEALLGNEPDFLPKPPDPA